MDPVVKPWDDRGEIDPRNNALRGAKRRVNLVKTPEIASSKFSIFPRN